MRSLPWTALLLSIVISLGVQSIASAHFLWIATGLDGESANTAVWIFEEAPKAGDGFYVDDFEGKTRTWVRSLASDRIMPLELTEVKRDELRYQTAEVAVAAPRSIETYGKFGVYPYGDINALLFYYAKFIDTTDEKALNALSRSSELDYDIVPELKGSDLKLTVFDHGKAVPKIEVNVSGPGRFRANLTTNKSGSIKLTGVDPGQWAFRATVVEPENAGEDEGEEYEQVRYTTTLILRLAGE